MKLYRMSPIAPLRESEIEGKRKWRLPNIRCPICPLTTGPMRPYPAVDLSGMENRSLFVAPKPVSVERFHELSEQIRPYIPAHLPVESTAGLGPFQGTTFQVLHDYAVAFLWGSPLMRIEAFKRLCDAGNLRLDAMPARIKSRKEPRPEMVELQIDGFVALAKEALPKEGLRVCPLCGRNNIKELRPEWVVVKRSSLPAHGNYFDLHEFPTSPIVTERLKVAIEAARLTNVQFHEIRVADE